MYSSCCYKKNEALKLIKCLEIVADTILTHLNFLGSLTNVPLTVFEEFLKGFKL